MKIINVGIIGLGTVGSGVAKALIEKRKLIENKTGISIKLVKVCDKDPRRAGYLRLPKQIVAKNSDEILNAADIDIVVELIGGIQNARKIILKAFKNRKHVVTANKALLAECGREIFEAASKHSLLIGFEASVCGAIPAIKTLKESFVANRINAMYGIVNGTCNFVLSKMADENCTLKAAVNYAKVKGIAEADPTLDLEGIDSAHKLSILAMLCFGCLARQKDIYIEGIKNIEFQDIVYARAWGYDIKLLAIAKRYFNSLQLRVHPTLLPLRYLLSSVKNEDNAIFIRGDMIGRSLLYGKGAGSLPAASSVISDIIDISRNIDNFDLKDKSIYSRIEFKSSDIKKISKIGDLLTRYYVRFSAIDKPGVLAAISSILAKNGISIATVSQKERKKGQAVPIVMLTHEAKESSMNRALKSINKLGFIKKKSVRIRIER